MLHTPSYLCKDYDAIRRLKIDGMAENPLIMWQQCVVCVTPGRWDMLESIALSSRPSMSASVSQIALAGLCPVQLELLNLWHYLD